MRSYHTRNIGAFLLSLTVVNILVMVFGVLVIKLWQFFADDTDEESPACEPTHR